MTGQAHSATELAKTRVGPASDAGSAGGERPDANAAATDHPHDEEPSPRDDLNEVEQAVLVALAGGVSAAEIATSLRTSEEVIGIHMANVLAKLHRSHAARSARQQDGVGRGPSAAKHQSRRTHRSSPA